MNKERSPLCVDLDGTLVKLDTLWQSIFMLLRKNPFHLLHMVRWALSGPAHLKQEVMQRVELNPTGLPYNPILLDFLRKEKEAGRKLLLTTAANEKAAQAIAEHLDCFDQVLASTSGHNLKAERKLHAIQKSCSTFSYAGDSAADLPIWDEAEEIILVNPSQKVRRKMAKKATHVLEDRPSTLKSWIRSIRINQWTKNLLIFVPILLGHQWSDPSTALHALVAFFSFSFMASAIYLLNDLFDISADQLHPRKRNRPLASGNLPLTTGLFSIPLLIMASMILGLSLSWHFCAILLIYLLLTTLYSSLIKTLAIFDVLTLTGLFTLRIFAGASATLILLSPWLIVFSVFFFLSLALVKRVAELKELEKSGDASSKAEGRGYTVRDLPLLLALGACSGFQAVQVFTLYINSDKAIKLYSNPVLLWMLCPLLLFWLSRIWLLVWRGRIKDDPLHFAAADVPTYLIGILSILIILTAI